LGRLRVQGRAGCRWRTAVAVRAVSDAFRRKANAPRSARS